MQDYAFYTIDNLQTAIDMLHLETNLEMLICIHININRGFYNKEESIDKELKKANLENY